MTAFSGAAPMNPSPAGDRPRRAVAPPLLTITSGRHGQWYILTLVGELDIAGVPQMQSAMDSPLATMDPPYIALDLADLSFCDSSGLNVILRAWKRGAQQGGELTLLGPHPRVTTVLQRTGLDQYLTAASRPAGSLVPPVALEQ
ncbi:STAS domain-containing protein [Actinomadura fulvescens]|uniref:Anti-sigma factor antagonist n=1 Tax=Actinomadura fulvescens TaxID=46160 RepID=A0ABP6CCB0_9ACTN